jgi:hypothetical protein
MFSLKTKEKEDIQRERLKDNKHRRKKFVRQRRRENGQKTGLRKGRF